MEWSKSELLTPLQDPYLSSSHCTVPSHCMTPLNTLSPLNACPLPLHNQPLHCLAQCNMPPTTSLPLPLQDRLHSHCPSHCTNPIPLSGWPPSTQQDGRAAEPKLAVVSPSLLSPLMPTGGCSVYGQSANLHKPRQERLCFGLCAAMLGLRQ